MDAQEPDEIESSVVSLYSLLYDDDLTKDELELYEVKDESCEAEVYLPDFGLNFEAWRQWSTEKRVEVLIHEFAHVENYEDDHYPSFWDRVVELTEVVTENQEAVEAVFDADLDTDTFRRTVVESIHEEVIETDTDTVEDRKVEVCEALGVSYRGTSAD